jgi:hypothetical protein
MLKPYRCARTADRRPPTADRRPPTADHNYAWCCLGGCARLTPMLNGPRPTGRRRQGPYWIAHKRNPHIRITYPVFCAETTRKTHPMTKHDNRKTNARNLSRILHTNYTTGLRLAEKSHTAIETKTEMFTSGFLRPNGLWGIANPDPAFPKGVRKTPWDWHPEDGFTRGGSARTPTISSGSRIMGETGMRADAAFILGTGIRSRKDEHITPPTHPARELIGCLPFAHTILDAQLFAELGFAARGTSWIMEDDEAHRLVVRELASLMAAALMDTANDFRRDEAVLVRVANTIYAQLAATENITKRTDDNYNTDDDSDEDIQWIEKLIDSKNIFGGYNNDLGGVSRRQYGAGYSASAVLFDVRKCRNVHPKYYAGAKRVGHFMLVVGPHRTRQFIEGMTDLFSALYVLGESKKRTA